MSMNENSEAFTIWIYNILIGIIISVINVVLWYLLIFFTDLEKRTTHTHHYISLIGKIYLA